MTLTYKVPKQIKTPFVKGEIVETCDRSLNTMDRVMVVKVTKRVVTLEDGREFRAEDGWWIGEDRAWPFPSIRHALKRPRKKNPDVDG